MSAAIEINPVYDYLVEPQRSPQHLKHNETFEHWNHVFHDVVSTINKFIGYLQDVGATFLHKIPWDDLYTLLVVPLAGDYGQIGQNGDACMKVGDAMHAWAGNIDRVGAGARRVWHGEAADGFQTQMAAYTLVMDGIGEAISTGRAVFSAVARVSERLGVTVEDAIVKLAKLIMKVFKKVISKISGIAGWLSLAGEVIANGFEYFRDLYDDIVSCIDLVRSCLALKDEVIGWAEVQRDRFQAFTKLPAIVERLPSVTLHDLATQTVDPTLRHDIEEIRAALSNERDKQKVQALERELEHIKQLTRDLKKG